MPVRRQAQVYWLHVMYVISYMCCDDCQLHLLKVAMKALMYYTEYFHVEYPLPKLDVIALADLSFGAMENWGLITYRYDFCIYIINIIIIYLRMKELTLESVLCYTVACSTGQVLFSQP